MEIDRTRWRGPIISCVRIMNMRAILAAALAGCGASETSNTVPQKLELSCSIPKTEFSVGQTLPPPKVTIHNGTDSGVDLIGPTITVIACTLVLPDRNEVRMCIAMPTGFDPRKMPARKLPSQTKIDFDPDGIWYYHDGIGYEPYLFSQEGTYEFFCQYEMDKNKPNDPCVFPLIPPADLDNTVQLGLFF